MPIIQTDKPLAPRREHDFYPTPEPFVRAGLSLLPPPFLFNPEFILDPGAGSGAWGKVARQEYPNADITGFELRRVEVPQAYDTWIDGDFRLAKPFPLYDLVMGNPPYKYTESFIKTSMLFLKPGGHLVFLLPLQFLAGQARGKGLWREHPPVKVVICSKRPSWTGDGKTDATDYAFFLWKEGVRNTPEIGWINPGE